MNLSESQTMDALPDHKSDLDVLLRKRNILTSLECAIRFLDVIGEAPGLAAEYTPKLDADVLAQVRNMVLRSEEEYYSSRFSIMSNPMSLPVERVEIDDSDPPMIHCFRRGCESPFAVEVDHPFRVAYETMKDFLCPN